MTASTSSAQAAACDVLLVTDIKFWREQQGNEARIAGEVDHFINVGLRVVVLLIGNMGDADAEKLTNRYPDLRCLCSDRLVSQTRLDRLQPKNVFTSLRRRATVAWWKLRGRPAPDSLDGWFRPECRRLLEQICRQMQPAVVLLEYLWLGYLIERPLPGLPVTIIDAHDVHALRWAAFQRQGITRGLAISARQERRVLSLADHVVAIQHDDLRTFQQLYRLRSVLLAMHAQRLKPLPWKSTGRVLFVGSDNMPNIEAARWLVSVWPRAVAGLERRVELHLVGSVCGAVDAQAVSGVVVHGRVQDLAPHYALAELVVNPVSFGSGLKIKTVEALCHGRPLLTTRVGAEGLASFADENTMRVVDDLDALLGQLREMLRDQSRGAAMSSAALAYAGEHFVPESAYRSLTDLISGVARSRHANSCSPARTPAPSTAI